MVPGVQTRLNTNATLVLRGGGWDHAAFFYCRSANRFTLFDRFSFGSFGFRVEPEK